MCRIRNLLCFLSLMCVVWAQDDCQQTETETLYCRGVRALRNAMRNLHKSDKPLVIMSGLEIVPLHNATARAATEAAAEQADATLLDSLALYLRTHEINLKLADLLADEQLERSNMVEGGYVSEARKKDKGQGMLLAVALMFGKMMAVLGLGGIGALALKALGVAMMALLMAGLLGLKQAAQHGHESTHSVSYLTAEGHHHRRRRRSPPTSQVVTEQAYRGWLQQ